MDAILAFLNYALFTAFGAPVTVLEVIAFVAGAACVYGVAKQYQWNWPVAIINALAFILLFVGVGLYADAALQLVFVALSVYGWVYWSWSKGGHANTLGKSEVPVRRTYLSEAIITTAATLAAYAGAVLLLHALTDSTVYWFDGFILAASLAATYLQARKVIESWWVWIAVDVVSIPLYFYKGLFLTGILYVVFLLLCIKGLVEWKRSMDEDRKVSPQFGEQPMKSFSTEKSFGRYRWNRPRATRG